MPKSPFLRTGFACFFIWLGQPLESFILRLLIFQLLDSRFYLIHDLLRLLGCISKQVFSILVLRVERELLQICLSAF